MSPQLSAVLIIMMIMYIYHALINGLSTHMIHTDPKYNILYTCRAPTKTVYIRYYMETHTHTHTHTHTNACTQ